MGESFTIRRLAAWAFKGDITVQIECDPLASPPVKLGLAVRAAVKSGANLSGADLSGANLSRANLSRADLYGAKLSGANLYGADLSGADLSRANLSGADLYGANLSGANLYGANLSGAKLSGANLSGAKLSGANLSGANLSMANLSGADLSRANLSRANLSGAKLSGANLSGANNHIPEKTTALAALPYLRGKIQAFKLVTADGQSPIHHKRVSYPIGKVVEETDCDRDPSNHCGAGLNVADLPWVLREWSEGQRILLIEHTAKDIACIPHGTDGKYRVSRLKVLRDITDELRANGVFGPVNAEAETA
ncbi:pentapeptide repeat-containing protein [Phenylobacterium soli]|uniref:pentapeptide repeat-containing protein n=1 Tax=Phenylobacterium soli TaxID=2170551 RepID=UPI001D044608|nr:pentapeptide repeat-containing protein [Phenylobacterium soli]